MLRLRPYRWRTPDNPCDKIAPEHFGYNPLHYNGSTTFDGPHHTRGYCPTQDTRGGKSGYSLALVRRLSVDDFELNLAMVPGAYGPKDDAERLSGVALPAYHAT